MLSVTAGHGDPTNNRNREATSTARMRSEHVCDGPEDCRRAVRSQVSQGAEVIKFAATGGVNSNIGAGLEQQLLPDEMRAIVETAHLLGLKVAAHAHGRNGIAAALEAGVDSIEHGTFTDAETNSLFKRYNAWLVPTVVAGAASLEMARQGATTEASLFKAEQAVAVQRENIAAAIEDGVRIAFGTDTGVADHGYNAREFQLLVELGMTPMDAIRAATVSAAELLGRSEQLGTLESGKQADIVAVDENPLEDVSSLETMSFVMKNGRLIMLDGERQAFPAAGYR
jgi:imidazolonepropionase-like amidohydrolase